MKHLRLALAGAIAATTLTGGVAGPSSAEDKPQPCQEIQKVKISSSVKYSARVYYDYRTGGEATDAPTDSADNGLGALTYNITTCKNDDGWYARDIVLPFTGVNLTDVDVTRSDGKAVYSQTGWGIQPGPALKSSGTATLTFAGIACFKQPASHRGDILDLAIDFVPLPKKLSDLTETAIREVAHWTVSKLVTDSGGDVKCGGPRDATATVTLGAVKLNIGTGGKVSVDSAGKMLYVQHAENNSLCPSGTVGTVYSECGYRYDTAIDLTAKVL
ncbi:hypothetical protein GCM10009795_062280 [Nocardioides hankookensis]|uniref:Secreted protein n=1 Tax=Nocardioides hankookensis TaxID=443157 RepID=A0ABW1LMG5_9ACTN